MSNIVRPLVRAEFSRYGDTRRSAGWTIKTDQHEIVTRWDVTEPPVVAEGTFRSGYDTFTVLFFTNAAFVWLDAVAVEGKPFLRDIWRPSIGQDRSSCVFAIAETFLEATQTEGS